MWIFKRAHEKYNWFWKEKSILLTKEKLKSHQDAKACYICGKRILKKFSKSTNYQKRDHCHCTGKYRSTTHSTCNLKFNVPNEIPVAFIRFKLWLSFSYKKFECLGENAEWHNTFSLPIEK